MQKVPSPTRYFWGAALALFIVYLAAVFSKPVYRKYILFRAEQFAEKSASEYEKNNLNESLILGMQSLKLNPLSLEGNLVMAKTLTRLGDVSALQFWSGVVGIEPENSNHKLSYANALIRFGQFEFAGEWLYKIKDDYQKDPGWLEKVCICAINSERFDEAQKILQQLILEWPENPNYKFNLACLQLRSTDAGLRQLSQESLLEFSKDSSFRNAALRNLKNHYLRGGETNEVNLIMSELAAGGTLTWKEKVRIAKSVDAGQMQALESQVAEWQEEIKEDAVGLKVFANYYALNGRLDEAKTLLENAPGLMRIPSILFLYTEVLLEMEKISETVRLLNPIDIGPLEFLKLGYLAVAKKRVKDFTYSEYWKTARNLAGNEFWNLKALADIAERWDLSEEAIDVYWAIARNSNRPQYGLQFLLKRLYPLKDRRPLRDALALIYQKFPHNFLAANDLAMIDLILNENIDRAAEISKKNYFRNPKSPAFIATFTLSLHRQGDNLLARKVYALMPEELKKKSASLKLIESLLLSRAGKLSQSSGLVSSLKSEDLSEHENELLKQVKRELFESISR